MFDAPVSPSARLKFFQLGVSNVVLEAIPQVIIAIFANDREGCASIVIIIQIVTSIASIIFTLVLRALYVILDLPSSATMNEDGRPSASTIMSFKTGSGAATTVGNGRAMPTSVELVEGTKTRRASGGDEDRGADEILQIARV